MRRIFLIIATILMGVLILVTGSYLFVVQDVSSNFSNDQSFKELVHDVERHDDSHPASISARPPSPIINTHNTSPKDIQPLVRYPAQIPKGADRSGYCDMIFSVSSEGIPYDIRTTNCSHPMFERNAIRAVIKYKYNTNHIDGDAVGIKNVTTKVIFRVTDEYGEFIPAK